MKRLIVAMGLVLAGSSVGMADDMTGAEIKALLAEGKTITLGGPGEGYQGKLTLNTDGTGKGSAKPDAGKAISISGKWKIKGNTFCRTWKGLDGGKEVCETWQKDGANRAIVMVGGTKVGVNSW